MYHIIDQPRAASEHKYCCTPERFAAQMAYLREAGYRVVDLATLLSQLENTAAQPGKLVAVTLDDGFACALHNAMPVLVRNRIPATLFVLSSKLGKSNDWMRSHATAPRALASAAQLREWIQAGLCVGSHTCTHPRLPEIDLRAAAEEIRGSKQSLEQVLGIGIDYFAYPFGLYNNAVRDEVEHAGYLAACSTRSGFNRGGVDRMQLRRIEVYGSDSLARFRQKLKFGANDVSAWFPLRYYAARLAERAGLRRSAKSDA